MQEHYRIIMLGVATLMLLASADVVRGEQITATTPLRIALVADPHVSLEEKHADYNVHFESVISEVNHAGVDAVLIAGDLANHGRPEEHRHYNEMIAGFEAPVFPVAGNHDVGNKAMPDKSSSLSEKRLAAYEERVGPLFYTAALSPDTRVVAVTSSLLGSGLEREQPQWVFLESQLRSHAGERVILLMHYPMYVDEPDEPGAYMNLEPEPRGRLLDLVKESGVQLVLTGHQHRPLERELDGIRMITAPPVSFGLPKGEQPEGWTLIEIAPNGDVSTELRYLEAGDARARAEDHP